MLSADKPNAVIASVTMSETPAKSSRRWLDPLHLRFHLTYPQLPAIAILHRSCPACGVLRGFSKLFCLFRQSIKVGSCSSGNSCYRRHSILKIRASLLHQQSSFESAASDCRDCLGSNRRHSTKSNSTCKRIFRLSHNCYMISSLTRSFIFRAQTAFTL